LERFDSSDTCCDLILAIFVHQIMNTSKITREWEM